MFNALDLSKFVSGDSLHLCGSDIQNSDLLNLTFLIPDSNITTIFLSDMSLHLSDIQSIIIYPELSFFVFKNCSIHPLAVKALIKSTYTQSLSFENIRIADSILDYLLNKKFDSLKHLSFKNCMISTSLIYQYVSKPKTLETLILDGHNLFDIVPKKIPDFRDGLYHFHQHRDGYALTASPYGQLNYQMLKSFFSQNQEIKSIQFTDSVVDESTINLLIPLKYLETIILNHCSVANDSIFKALKLMLPNLKSLMQNGRNLLERADFLHLMPKSINSYLVFEKKLKLSHFGSGLSSDGKTLTIDAELFKKINFADLNIFLIHQPEVTRIVLKDIAIAHWMAIVLSFCKTCQKMEFIRCKIKDEALGQLIEGLKDLVELNLQQTKFDIITTRAISASPRLGTLKLSQTQISIDMAKRFAMAEQFSNLKLTACEIDSLSFKHLIEKPKSIRKLFIANMPIDETVIKAITARGELQDLQLNQTAITEQQLALLMENASFESLGLNGEKLEMAHANHILKHSGLKRLDVSRSEISGVFLRRIARHHLLQEINLFSTNINFHSKSLAFFIAVSRVRSLNLSACQLDDNHFEVLHQVLDGHQIQHVKALNLSQNNISNKALVLLQSILRPSNLDLSHTLCGMSKDFPSELFSSLNTLNLSHSKLTDDVLGLFSDSQLLKHLNIVGNAITEHGLINLVRCHNAIISLNYDSQTISAKLQSLIIKKLVINYQAHIIDDAQVLFNHLFKKIRDVSQCFGILKHVYDDHILSLVEKNLGGLDKLNYVYGR